jgi:hypothetical protein
VVGREQFEALTIILVKSVKALAFVMGKIMLYS